MNKQMNFLWFFGKESKLSLYSNIQITKMSDEVTDSKTGLEYNHIKHALEWENQR